MGSFSADSLTNVALNKSVVASSLWVSDTPSSYAVDGDTSSTFHSDGHCAVTGKEVNPHMVIDLQGTYNIQGFELWVFDTDDQSKSPR